MQDKTAYTYDYIHGTDIYLYQRKDMFRTNTDTALLAQFMQIHEGDRVLDIGTNNGALLLAASKYHPSFLFGIEIQEEAVKLAQYNMIYHQIYNYEIMCGDVCEMALPKVHVVVCNPPYFKMHEQSNVNVSHSLKTARHEVFLPLHVLAEKMGGALDTKGRAYIVHRANRIGDILATFQQARLQVRTLQFVYDQNKTEAISVLIEFVKDGNVNCHVLPPQIITR